MQIKEKDELEPSRSSNNNFVVRSDSGTVNINVAKYFCLFGYMKQNN